MKPAPYTRARLRTLSGTIGLYASARIGYGWFSYTASYNEDIANWSGFYKNYAIHDRAALLPKVPGGLDQVLYLRAGKDLLAKLEKVHAARNKDAAVSLSKADAARALITRAVEEDMQQQQRQEKLSGAQEVDRFEEGWTQVILKGCVTDYFASTEAQRLAVLQDLEQAVAERSDLVSTAGAHGVEFRHRWPDACRNALLAIWRTPKA